MLLLQVNALSPHIANCTSQRTLCLYASSLLLTAVRFQEEVPWQRQEITIMGRKVMQPRLVAYMADDPSMSYTYSHAQQTALPWSLTVARIKVQHTILLEAVDVPGLTHVAGSCAGLQDKIEQLAGTSFNSCLLNLYESGQHHLGWHSDNERLYGPLPTIGNTLHLFAVKHVKCHCRQTW